jgi:hypothetical protein
VGTVWRAKVPQFLQLKIAGGNQPGQFFKREGIGKLEL